MEALDKEIESLTNELEELGQRIDTRRQEAIDKMLFEKLEYIIRNLGEYTDWGGGEYNYHGRVFHGCLSNNGRCFIRIKIGEKEVFSGYKTKRDFLYLPGEWCEKLDELYTKATIRIKEKKIEYLQNTIQNKKKEWNIE